MKRLRILLADDHALVLHGARVLLEARAGWKVVGEALNGREAVEKAKELKPDVAIVDISMPELDGVEVVREIRKAVPEIKVLILTMHESDQMVLRALEAGARGYLLKSDLSNCLPKALKTIIGDELYLTPKVSEIVVEGFISMIRQTQEVEPAGTLVTHREIEIIRLLTNGKTNKEIAAMLGITVRTVETHRSKIMLKLGLHSLAELIHYALRNRMISA